MDAKLVVVGGEAESAQVQLILPTIIGRGRDASVTLPHPLVSRQHCEIFESGGKLFVRDLGSLNGTYVNNERIEGDRELPDGELLTIGTVTFRAVYFRPEQQPLKESAAGKAGAETLREKEGVATDRGQVQSGRSVPATAATVQFSGDSTDEDDFDDRRAKSITTNADSEDETDHLGNALDSSVPE